MHDLTTHQSLVDLGEKSCWRTTGRPREILCAPLAHSSFYENDTYRHLVRQHGVDKVYILSAGWGLIGAEFLTPMYDITFSATADSYKIRRKRHQNSDLCLLPADTDDDIVFFGGKDYTPLFCSLTRPMRTRKTIFYNSQSPPEAPGCVLERFATPMRTNWHYECARAFLAGKITLG
jgi:hypothetical protein